MSILLIWQEIPENLTIYEFPSDHPDREKILACHNKYINSDDLPEDHPIFYVNDRMADENGVNYYQEYMLFTDKEEPMTTGLPHATIDTIIVSGFFL